MKTLGRFEDVTFSVGSKQQNKEKLKQTLLWNLDLNNCSSESRKSLSEAQVLNNKKRQLTAYKTRSKSLERCYNIWKEYIILCRTAGPLTWNKNIAVSYLPPKLKGASKIIATWFHISELLVLVHLHIPHEFDLIGFVQEESELFKTVQDLPFLLIDRILHNSLLWCC